MFHTSIFGRWESAAGRAETKDERFTAFVDRNARFVYRVAYAVLRNAADAEDGEDAAQETFLKLYRLQAWQAAQNGRAFLAWTAWRVAIGRKRAKEDPLDGKEVPWRGRNPEEAAIADDQAEWVRRLMDALPAELRVPLALSSVDDLTSAEIGMAMELAEGTVRNRIWRARQILKAKIEERYGSR